jgi:hypothetical protein
MKVKSWSDQSMGGFRKPEKSPFCGTVDVLAMVQYFDSIALLINTIINTDITCMSLVN